MMYTVYGRFEWDSEKAQLNLQKHGINFQMAAFAFDDPWAFVINDDKHSQDEIREWLIGESDSNILVVVFTIRIGEKIRIISARRANYRERMLYEENKGV